VYLFGQNIEAMDLSFFQMIGGFVALYITAFLFFVIRRKMRSPEKSFKNCAINVALTPMKIFKIGPFKQGKISLESSMKEAVRKAKLTDFGVNSADLVETYNKIMDSKSFKNQRFHNLGYISAGIEINMTLARRLTFCQYLKENPKVETVPVNAPVFVMGLPRTGTTFLHRLLSLDPAFRAPMTWELLNPVPKPQGHEGSETDLGLHAVDRERRRKYVKKILATRRSMGDDALAHIHEVGADLPEECLLCLSDNLPCLPMLLYDDYFNYERFLSIDAKPAYATYKKYLQLLSYQTNDFKNGNNGVTLPKRWMLKCPIHLFYPKEVGAIFPDAKLIWNHRHPVSAVPSLCSLLKAFHMLYYEPECRDDAELGRVLKIVSENVLEQTPKDIAASGLDCAHVLYNDLIKRPEEVVKGIYKQFNWTYSDEYDAILKKYLKKNNEEREAMKKKQGGKGPLHTYSPEEFGLTAEELSSGKYAEYCQRFNVAMSRG